MSTNFIPPELQDALVGLYGNKPAISGAVPDRVAPGLYKFTLPDGSEILVDENGNIIG